MAKPVPTSSSGTPLVWKVVGGLAMLIVGYLLVTWVLGTLFTIFKVAVVVAILIAAASLFMRTRD